MLWLDAFTANVDRSWRNPNLLLWHGDLWVIDHGASLYFHHGWRTGVTDPEKFAAQAWDVGGHVFEECAHRARELDEEIAARSNREVFVEVLAEVPDVWLEPVPGARDARRAAHGVRRLPRRPPRHPPVAPGGVAMTATRLAYQYVVLRCVPRPEREEFVNVGVVLHCQSADFLDATWSVDAERLRALDPDVDVDQVCDALTFVDWVCRGDERGARPHGSRSDSGSASSRPHAAPCSSPAPCTAG